MRSEKVFLTLSNLATRSQWQIARSLTCLVFMLVCVDSPASADDTADYAKACAKYSHGDYQGAADLMTGLVQGSYKGDATAHYYLGNAFLGLGKLEDAHKEYTAALQLPASPELKQYCQKAIEQSRSKVQSGKGNSLNSRSASVGTALNSTRGASPSAVPSGNISPGATPSAARSKVEPDALDRRFIAIQRHTADTDAVYDQVVVALTMVPKSVKEELVNYGAKILITPTVIEANPAFATEKPRGYIHGGGYDNCPGLYSSATKDLYIAERASRNNSPPQLNRWVLSVVLHELGHAYDYCKSRLSAGEEFLKAYQEDCGRLTNSQRTKFHYFVQEADAGPSELFAELFSATQARRAHIPEYSPGLPEAFRKSFEYVNNIGYY